MPPRKVSTDDALAPAEAVLLDVLRMVLDGHAAEVPARVRKIVSTTAGRRRVKLSAPARAAIAVLLSEQHTPAGPPRRPAASLRDASLRGAPVNRALTSSPTPPEAPAPVLDSRHRAALDDIVGEYRERARLETSGLTPSRTILLSGAPGTGKSMTIAFLAGRLEKPLIRIEPADVIGSFLGESARLLSTVFEQAREEGAILALDEIDALAKRRDDLYDVGEFKRFVTTLLVELDRWHSGAPLIAATNHLELLDPALERRFEVHIRLQPPGAEERRAIIEQELQRLEVTAEQGVLDTLVDVLDRATGAELTGLVHRAARRHVLHSEPIERALLLAALSSSSQTLDRSARAKFAAAAHDRAGLSTRRIGELLGCSHTAAGRLVKAAAHA